MAMKVISHTFPGVPDLTRHNRSAGDPRPAYCIVCTEDDCGYFAAYEGIILVDGELNPVQENAFELLMYRGRKLNAKRAGSHFTGVADRYRH